MTRSLLRSLIRETLLTEEVYGAQATVYHGTEADPVTFIRALLNDELRPGSASGSMYGKGLYTVYDLNVADRRAGQKIARGKSLPDDGSYESRTARGDYGASIIKLKLNLYGFIIFDPDVAEIVYGSELTPVEQAQKIGLGRGLIEKLREVPLTRPGDFTSSAALAASKFLEGRVKGLVFTGRIDGHVVVIYDPTVAVPFAWKRVGDPGWTPVDRSHLLEPKERNDILDSSGRPVSQSAIRRSALGGWEEEKYDIIAILKKLERQPESERVFDRELDLRVSAIESLPAGLKVFGDLRINKTDQLKSLPPRLEVAGSLIAVGSAISHIPADIKVGRDIDLTSTSVESIPDGLVANRNLYLDSTPIKSLPDGLQVGGNLYLDSTPIKSLPSGLRVGGSLTITNTPIKSLPADLQVGGSIWGFKGNKSKLPLELRYKLS